MSMTLSSIAALSATMFVLSAVPGPSDVAVVARSIAAGFRHGVIFTLGIVTADALFLLLAALSLTTLAENAGSWFTLVKYAGAAYLIWLGITAIRTRTAKVATNNSSETSTHSSFMSGLLITLGDPKAILFYFGLLPAFVDLAKATLTDYLVIIVVATLVIGIVKLGYAYLGSRATALFNNPRARRQLNAIAGCVLVGTGLFLLLQS